MKIAINKNFIENIVTIYKDIYLLYKNKDKTIILL